MKLFNRKMKITNLILVLAVAMFFTNCKDDDNSVDRSIFVATYGVVETCGSGNDTYDMTISESSTSDDGILIANLYNWGVTATATVDGDNLTIPSQTLDGLTFAGSGTVNDNILNLTFSVGATGYPSESCTAVCTKK